MNRWIGFFFFAVLSIGGDLFAQKCGDLSGTVLDPSAGSHAAENNHGAPRLLRLALRR
jgi:hypothetical protein